MLRLLRSGVLLALVLLSVGASFGAEIDKYLPNDTNAVVSLNTGQVIDSPLLQKTYLPLLVKELAAKPDLLKLFKDFNFDPFRDLDRVQIALADSCERGGSDKNEPGFCLIARGKFNLPKVHAHLAALMPHLNKALTAHKSGTNFVYELNLDGKTFFFALPERTTLVLAPRREHINLVLERAAGKKPVSLVYKDVQELITKTDGKQVLWLVATGRTTLSFEPTFVAGKPMTRKTLADSEVYEVSGGVTLADGAKGSFAVKLKSEPAAKAVSEALQVELAKSNENGFNGALEDRRLAPIREFLRDMVIAGDGKHIVIQSEVPGRVFTNAVK